MAFFQLGALPACGVRWRRNLPQHGVQRAGTDGRGIYFKDDRAGRAPFRIEFVNETPEQVVQMFAKHRQLLRGEITSA